LRTIRNYGPRTATPILVVGQVLTGQPPRAFIGACVPNAFEERLRSVLDPHGRFTGT